MRRLNGTDGQGKSGRISRRLFIGAALGAVSSPVWASPPARSLRPIMRPDMLGVRKIPAADTLVGKARLDARVAYSVADVTSGLVLEGRDSQIGVPPASVAKSITALYAMDRLGAEYRFVTRLIGTGPVEGGVLKGDLVLAGGGDPSLDTDALAEMASALKAGGVHSVSGRFLVWDGALPYVPTVDPDQPDHVGYSPSVSGLNLNFNRVHFEWRKKGKAWSVTMDARTKKYRPDVTVSRMRIADRGTPVYIYADRNGRDEWSVAAGALGNGGARWLPVRKPALYAGEVFQTLARSHGIVLKNAELVTSLPNGRALVRHESDQLSDLLKDMLKYSTNLTAEVVGLMASGSAARTAQPLVASSAAMNQWAAARFGVTDMALRDHSGLSGDSRVTSGNLVSVLTGDGVKAQLRPLLKTIGLRDEQRRVDKNHPIKVQAKTGTLNFVSGLAGYMTGPDGTDLAFAIFAPDVDRRAALSEAERERPQGAKSWNGRAKRLQQALIERWGALYSTA